LPADYLLYVGTIEPRKNLPTLLQAYRILLDRMGHAPTLVIAGRKGWLHSPVFRRVTELDLGGQVQFTDWIEQADLPALFSGATAFVYPSLYEGFGLPPLEAMACGTPVICSNASALPEVVGEGGLLVDPRDAGALARAMEQVLTDTSLRADLSARGLAQASKFSWERTARETLAVYDRVARKQHAYRD
jgi:glycosyltransferase involved in cell wall biosynthesis